MTSFTDTWNAGFEALPPDTVEAASQGALRIRRHKLAVRERLAVCHSWAGDAHDGKLLVGRFRPSGGDPTLETGDGGFYTKVVSSVNELFYKDDAGTVQQLTRAGRLIPFADPTDPTKRVKFDLSGLTTGVERELKVPDYNITLGNWSTGDVKLTLKTTADTGWVMMNDGSIGSAASGATTRANADTEALYTLIWNNISDTWAPVAGGRGGSAASDFAADKALTLPRTLGRALAVSGSGASLTARALGEFLGVETHQLTEAQTPVKSHAHGAGSLTGTESPAVSVGNAGGIANNITGGGNIGTTNLTISISGSTAAASDATASAHPNMQPSSFLNVMVKL
jgi:microcystin-dependent protein